MEATEAKPMAPLPTTRTFITNLLSSLKHTNQNTDDPPLQTTTSKEQASTNPLRHFTDNQKALLMTLHILFPNELLPALDLLDRDLVTQFTLASPPPADHEASMGISTAEHDDRSSRGATYYVRSAQHANTNSRRYHDPVASSSHYEVRTAGWSCSCPAFAFSAFPSSGVAAVSAVVGGSSLEDAETGVGEVYEDDDGAVELASRGGEGWGVGGLALGEGVPVCKHLLACALVEGAGSVFEGFVRRQEVGVEELAGWAAGWGG